MQTCKWLYKCSLHCASLASAFYSQQSCQPILPPSLNSGHPYVSPSSVSKGNVTRTTYAVPPFVITQHQDPRPIPRDTSLYTNPISANKQIYFRFVKTSEGGGKKYNILLLHDEWDRQETAASLSHQKSPGSGSEPTNEQIRQWNRPGPDMVRRKSSEMRYGLHTVPWWLSKFRD